MDLNAEWMQAVLIFILGMLLLFSLKKYLRKLKNYFFQGKTFSIRLKKYNLEEIEKLHKESMKLADFSFVEEPYSKIINEQELSSTYKKSSNDKAVTRQELNRISLKLRREEYRLLARELKLTDLQVDEIEASCMVKKHGEAEICYQLFQEWKKHNDKAAIRDVLKTALLAIQREEIADEIFENLPGTSFSETLRYQYRVLVKRIEQNQRERCKTIELPQVVWTEKILPLEELYIDLELLNTVGDYGKGRMIYLQELFNRTGEDDPLRILIEGGPGYGKTSLCLKLLNDWGHNRTYIGKKFKMVFLFELRYFKERDSIEEILKSECEVIGVNGDDGLRCVNAYQNETLLILDGFDEMKDEGKTKFLPLLLKKTYPSMYVVVTSRTGMFNVDRKKEIQYRKAFEKNYVNRDPIDHWSKRILINGVTTDKINTFLRNYFIEDYTEFGEKSNSIINGEMREVYKCPLFLILLAIMLEEKKPQSINSKTTLYKEFFNFITRRNLIREKKISDDAEVDIFSNSPEHITRSLHRFGRLALEHLCENKLIFEEKDVIEQCKNKLILQLGFLIKIPEIQEHKREIFYQPIHKSFHEFVAAFTMWNLFNTNEHQFKTEIERLGRKGLKPTNDSLFYVFLGGLMNDEAYVLFQCLTRYSLWFNIENVCFTNMLLEIKDIHSFFTSLEPILDSFISPYYSIDDFKGLTRDYFQSDIHSMILKHASKRQLVNVFWWDSDFCFNLSHELHVECVKLYLSKEVFSMCSYKNRRMIKCKTLICHFSPNFEFDKWNDFVSMVNFIQFEKINFLINSESKEINSLVLNLLHKELIDGRWKLTNIDRLRFEFNERDDPRSLSLLVDLVKKKRIKEGVYLWIKDSQKRTEDDVKILKKETEELFNAVMESISVEEFVVINYDYKFSPELDFSRFIKLHHLKSFHFIGSINIFNSNEKEIEKCILEEATILSSDVNKNLSFIQNLQGIRYLNCGLTSLREIECTCFNETEELEISITDAQHFRLLSRVSDVCYLQVLTLELRNVEAVVLEYKPILYNLFSSLTLRICEFSYIENFELFSFLAQVLMEGLSRKENDRHLIDSNLGKTPQLQELVILFNNSINFNELKECNGIECIQSMLRNKQLLQCSWVDYKNCNVTSSELEFLFPSNDGFRISYEVNGMNPTSSRQSQFNYRWFLVFDKFCIKFFELDRYS